MKAPTMLPGVDWTILKDDITKTSIAAGAAKFVYIDFNHAPDVDDIIIRPIVNVSTGAANVNMSVFTIKISDTQYALRIYNWGGAASGNFKVYVNVYSHDPTLTMTLSENT